MYKNDVAIVIVHAYKNMPQPQDNIRWEEYSKRVVDGINKIKHRPRIWQLDFVNHELYIKLLQTQIDRMPGINLNKWHQATMTNAQGDVIHPDVDWTNSDFISSSIDQTRMLIDWLDSDFIMFAGLHKDRCVKAAMTELFTEDREYFISERLSFSYLETMSAIYKDIESNT